MKKFFQFVLLLKQRYLEAFIWILALVLLIIAPVQGEHYSLCVFHNIGLGFCPGCGLGHSITYFFHGNIKASLFAHPLGIPAIAILLYRIFIIFKQNKKYQPNKIIHYG